MRCGCARNRRSPGPDPSPTAFDRTSSKLSGKTFLYRSIGSPRETRASSGKSCIECCCAEVATTSGSPESLTTAVLAILICPLGATIRLPVAEAIAIGGYGDRRVRLYVIRNENIGCTRIVNIQHQHHRRR